MKKWSILPKRCVGKHAIHEIETLEAGGHVSAPKLAPSKPAAQEKTVVITSVLLTAPGLRSCRTECSVHNPSRHLARLTVRKSGDSFVLLRHCGAGCLEFVRGSATLPQRTRCLERRTDTSRVEELVLFRRAWLAKGSMPQGQNEASKKNKKTITNESEKGLPASLDRNALVYRRASRTQGSRT